MRGEVVKNVCRPKNNGLIRPQDCIWSPLWGTKRLDNRKIVLAATDTGGKTNAAKSTPCHQGLESIREQVATATRAATLFRQAGVAG